LEQRRAAAAELYLTNAHEIADHATNETSLKTLTLLDQQCVSG
jgi:hypothetical protein